MTIKTDIKRLLSQGLTGWQAGLLVFEDSWRETVGADSLLTEKDISLLKSGLRTQKDTQDYNKLIGLYRTADYLNRQAVVSLFMASSMLERTAGIGFMVFATYMARTALRSLPLPVTEKELASHKKTQRRQLLKRYYCLEQVIGWRAYTLASDELKKELDIYPPSGLEIMEKEAPELYQQAEAEVQALIGSGKLKPVKLDILPSTEEVRSGERQDIDWYPAMPGWTPERTESRLLTYLQGQQLYKIGLPEWKEWIDTFKVYLLDKEHWLAGDAPPYVAIVQEPEKYDLDRRGHFKKDFMSHWPLSPKPLGGIDISELQDSSSSATEVAILAIRKALARRQVLEELGQVIGLALEEVVDFDIEAELEPSLGRYNMFASELPAELEKLSTGGEGLSDEEEDKAFEQLKTVEHTAGTMMALAAEIKLKLPPIRLDKIKPSAKELAEVRDWISPILGDSWWKQASQTAKKPKSILPEVIAKYKSKEEAEDES